MDTVSLAKDGGFNKEFHLKENRFILLRALELDKDYILPIQAGENYQVTIGKDKELEIKGQNEEGIKLYQSVLQYSAGKLDWSLFNSEPANRNSRIQQIKLEELDKFKQLLNEKKITKSFYNLIENDRNCFYSFVSIWLCAWDMMAIFRNQETDHDNSSKKIVINHMTKIFDKYKPNDKNLMKSPTWESYALFMYIDIYKQYVLQTIDKANIEEILFEHHIPFWFEQIKESFSGETLEAALAVFIYKKGGMENFTVSEESIPVYEFFKKQFPNSKYSKYFDAHMQKTLSYYNQKTHDSSIHFIENGDSINTFSQLLSQMEGQKLYIDIWATWCNPCRYEFQFNDSLHSILRQNNITPLYISLDEDNQTKKWEALIQTYNLRGMHFRANKLFKNDLNELYQDESNSKTNQSGQKTFSIPWYMLIDENGNIIEKHFKRPSEIVSSKTLR